MTFFVNINVFVNIIFFSSFSRILKVKTNISVVFVGIVYFAYIIFLLSKVIKVKKNIICDFCYLPISFLRILKIFKKLWQISLSISFSRSLLSELLKLRQISLTVLSHYLCYQFFKNFRFLVLYCVSEINVIGVESRNIIECTY